MVYTLLLLLVVASGGALAAHLWRFVAYHRLKGLPVPRRFGASLVREALALVVVGWWHVRAWLSDQERRPAIVRGRPVVFVHGYSQNASNFHGMRRALEAHGRPTIGISLLHRLGPPTWYARRLERRLDVLTRAFPDGIDLVAHSMGGIVLRMVLRSRPDLQDGLVTVVTLGSPHRGTAAARGIPWVPEIRALTRSSRLLAELPTLLELAPRARIVAIAGDADTIVYPVESALVPGAEAVVLAGVGHAGLLVSGAAHEALLRALSQGVPLVAPPGRG